MIEKAILATSDDSKSSDELKFPVFTRKSFHYNPLQSEKL